MSALRRRLLQRLGGPLLVLCLAGCAGYAPALEDCRRLAAKHDFAGALEKLEDSGLQRGGKNRLLYLMEKGALLHLQGDYQASNRALERADRLAEELYTRSLSRESLSLVSNDRVIPYAGEDYESLYLHYFKILNYLGLGKADEAAVECRRLDEKLNFLSGSPDDQSTLRGAGFLRLLTGLVYELQGDFNNALVAYRQSLQAYREHREDIEPAVPRQLWGRLLNAARRMDFAEEYRRYRERVPGGGALPEATDTGVAVIIGNGLVPVKRETFALVPTEYGFAVKLAVPELVARPCRFEKVRVAVDGPPWRTATRVENVGALARGALAEKKARVLAKAATRAAAKQLLARQIEEEAGPLAGLAAQVAALATENADLRAWSTLPGEVLLAVLPAAPGWHTVSIRYGDGEQHRAVRVENGRLGIVFVQVL